MLIAALLGLAAAIVTYSVITLVMWNKERRERAAIRRELTARLSQVYEMVLSANHLLARQASGGIVLPDHLPDTLQPDIAAEAMAFLDGSYQFRLELGQESVPAWAWINTLAHGSLADIAALADRAKGASGPEAITGAIAVQIVDVVGRGLMALEDIQRQTLLPLEEHLSAALLPAAGDEAEVARILAAAIVDRPRRRRDRDE